MLTTHQQPLELSPTARLALLEPTLAALFQAANSSDYIKSINYFVLQRMEQKKLSANDNIHLYHLLHLIQSLPELEKF